MELHIQTSNNTLYRYSYKILNPTYGTDDSIITTHRFNNTSNSTTSTVLDSNGCDNCYFLEWIKLIITLWQLDNTITNNTANLKSIGCDSIATLDLTIIQTPQTSAGPDVNSCSLKQL